MRYCLALLALLLLALGSAHAQALDSAHPVLTKEELLAVKKRVVELINRNRRALGLRPVELDELASEVADRHCFDMLKGDFLSHWNPAGLKPYMRYSNSGGVDAVVENVSALWGSVSFNPEYIYNTLEELHMRMFNEQPPNDGHRQSIIGPQHTHVGIGIAYSGTALRYAEEYIARYAEIQSVPRKVKAGDRINIKGRLLSDKYDLSHIDIFYEKLPDEAALKNFLTGRFSYGLPDTSKAMRPSPPAGYLYADGTAGDFTYERSSRKFDCPINFRGAQPGIYTIVLVARDKTTKFAVTNISVEVE